MAFAAWFTGLPGSGKTTIAKRTARLMERRGVHVKLLHLDEVRRFVTPEPTYTEEERETVYRALAYMAFLLTGDGCSVFVDATANRARWRDAARGLIPHFAEVYVRCPLEVAVRRERERAPGMAPAGIYAKSGKPDGTVPGVDVSYEEPEHPEIEVDSSNEGAWELAALIADRLAKLFPEG